MANLTLARRDSYLEYLYASVKQDTLTALRSAPIYLIIYSAKLKKKRPEAKRGVLIVSHTGNPSQCDLFASFLWVLAAFVEYNNIITMCCLSYHYVFTFYSVFFSSPRRGGALFLQARTAILNFTFDNYKNHVIFKPK